MLVRWFEKEEVGKIEEGFFNIFSFNISSFKFMCLTMVYVG